jgi:predicted ester cyclase
MATMTIMTQDEARAIIEPFYDLFRSSKRDWDKGLAALDDDWKGYYANGDYRTKSDTQPYLQGLFDIVPDMNVEIIEVFTDGETIGVRSELSGTPCKEFMVPYSGRRFSIMTIDMHKVRDGKITALYHLEDWGTAIRQLS